jgi:hypothetical protein
VQTPDYIRYLHDTAIKAINTFTIDTTVRCPTAEELQAAKDKMNDMYSSVTSTFSQSTATTTNTPM